MAVETVKKARGVGVIFAQFLTKDIASSFDIPCVQVDYQVGTAILAYTTSMRYANSAIYSNSCYNLATCSIDGKFPIISLLYTETQQFSLAQRKLFSEN